MGHWSVMVHKYGICKRRKTNTQLYVAVAADLILRGSLRTNLVNLFGWGRGEACVAMETLTDGVLVLTESWAGL